LTEAGSNGGGRTEEEEESNRILKIGRKIKEKKREKIGRHMGELQGKTFIH